MFETEIGFGTCVAVHLWIFILLSRQNMDGYCAHSSRVCSLLYPSISYVSVSVKSAHQFFTFTTKIAKLYDKEAGDRQHKFQKLCNKRVGSCQLGDGLIWVPPPKLV